MAYRFQVAIDAVDPHAQADWWAETMGWSVEPSDEGFIQSMIDQGYAEESDTLRHHGALVWATGAAICPPDQVDDLQRTRWLFQTVPESKTVKNRVHWDVRIDGADLDEVRDQLVARGATFLHTASQGPHTWHTLTDPEGNEFCVS